VNLACIDINKCAAFTDCFLHYPIKLITEVIGGQRHTAGILVLLQPRSIIVETQEAKTRRSEQRKQKELRVLAARISSYAQSVHQQFPSGDVVVSERDLAEQLRKRPDAVVTALNLLLNERKVQRAPLGGYWKLNQ
jgi:hypothetical protein